MKTVLTFICLAVLALMLFVTTSASLHQDIVTAGRMLWPDPWFRATLADAYCGFFFFYLWLFYREKGVASRIVWFVLIMTFGNISMAAYLLLQLRTLRPGDGIELLFQRKGTV